MNFSLRSAAALWWSFTWHLLLYGLPFTVLVGFSAGRLADALGMPQLHLAYVFLSSELIWVPMSIVALKLALDSRSTSTGLVQPSWRMTLVIWWSFLWRSSVYGALMGFALGIIVSMFVGKPSEHPYYLLIVWPAMIPLSILALQKAVSKKKIQPSMALETAASSS